MKRLSRALIFAVTLSVFFAVGCGGGSTPVDQKAQINGDMQSLADTYKFLAEKKRRPPSKLSDLSEFEPGMPALWSQLVSGDVVLVYGVGFLAGNQEVLAYPKNAETQGGTVLLRDGTVKVMTADEFKAAPKAKK